MVNLTKSTRITPGSKYQKQFFFFFFFRFFLVINTVNTSIYDITYLSFFVMPLLFDDKSIW